MTCPKCEEGTIKKITFKKNGENALFCSHCETVWLADESILANSGHLLNALTKDGDMDYIFTLDENPEKLELESEDDDDDSVDNDISKNIY